MGKTGVNYKISVETWKKEKWQVWRIEIYREGGHWSRSGSRRMLKLWCEKGTLTSATLYDQQRSVATNAQ